MYVVTGGAGFIGSAFVARLNQMGTDDILIVDELGDSSKWLNLRSLRYTQYLHKDDFHSKMNAGLFKGKVDAVIHMGACSSTTETDVDYLMRNNVEYSKDICRFALKEG